MGSGSRPHPPDRRAGHERALPRRGDSAAGPVQPGARDEGSACRPGACVAGVTTPAGGEREGEHLDPRPAAVPSRGTSLIEGTECERVSTGSERKSVVLVHTMEWGTKRRR